MTLLLGVLVVSRTTAGTGLVSLAGANNDIDASELTLTGEGGSTYILTDTADVDITDENSFSLILSVTDKAAVNALLNKDGTSSLDDTTYKLSAAASFNGAGAGLDTTNAVTVSNTTLHVTDLADHTVLVYPVPVQETLTLDFGVHSMGTLRLHTLLGNEVLQKSVASSQATLDMQELPTGIYLFRIETDNVQKTLKVVKE